jgi:hypothetical protein
VLGEKWGMQGLEVIAVLNKLALSPFFEKSQFSRALSDFN